MKNKYKDEYNNISKDIINNKQFLKLKDDLHHGSNKYEHLIRVSKCSYVLGKIFKANINSVTKAALLHDFFYGTRKEKAENSYLNHPSTAIRNAKQYFEINLLEEEAIKTHMFHHILIKKLFPFINRKEKALVKNNKPKSKEAWIVCVSDLLISIIECTRYEILYVFNLSVMMFLSLVFFKN